MADWSDLAAATQAVADPSTPAEDLAAITGAQKSLWVPIARHPNAYPALLDWLSAQGDEEVRAAVASRGQTAVSFIPPAAPTAVPATAFESAPVVAPAPKRSKKPLVIAGIGVVAVAIALVIVFTTLSSSVLRYDQAQVFADNLQAEDVEMYTGDQVRSIWGASSIMSNASECQKLTQLTNQVQGYTGFDASGYEFVAFIMNNHSNALSFVDAYLECVSSGESDKVFSQEASSVSLSIWEMTDEPQEVRAAVYKNVMLLTSGASVDTRAAWQTYMTTNVKSAMDKAIKS